jgi:VanZ family protein
VVVVRARFTPGPFFALTLWLGLFVFIGVFRPDRAHGLRAFLLLLSIGVAVGAVWEVAEWGADELTSADMIKGKYDTVLDIIMDIAGSVLAALLAITVVARGSGSLLDER